MSAASCSRTSWRTPRNILIILRRRSNFWRKSASRITCSPRCTSSNLMKISLTKAFPAALLATLLAAPAMADPPAHAPAHGYRNKEARKFRGYTGTEWPEDYGVSSGRCNTDTVLTVIGAAGGAIIANRTADRDNRAIATVLGAVIGGVIGNKIG